MLNLNLHQVGAPVFSVNCMSCEAQEYFALEKTTFSVTELYEQIAWVMPDFKGVSDELEARGWGSPAGAGGACCRSCAEKHRLSKLNLNYPTCQSTNI